jgi:hypothetical protein
MGTTSSSNQKRDNLILSRLQTKSYLNKVIKHRTESDTVIAKEITQSNDKIMDLLKRIEDRKARTYHNDIGIDNKEETTG